MVAGDSGVVIGHILMLPVPQFSCTEFNIAKLFRNLQYQNREQEALVSFEDCPLPQPWKIKLMLHIALRIL